MSCLALPTYTLHEILSTLNMWDKTKNSSFDPGRKILLATGHLPLDYYLPHPQFGGEGAYKGGGGSQQDRSISEGKVHWVKTKCSLHRHQDALWVCTTDENRYSTTPAQQRQTFCILSFSVFADAVSFFSAWQAAAKNLCGCNVALGLKPTSETKQ